MEKKGVTINEAMNTEEESKGPEKEKMDVDKDDDDDDDDDEVSSSSDDDEDDDDEEDEDEDEGRVIRIPILDETGAESTEDITFSVNPLPDVHDVLGILQGERAALWRWLQVAGEYYKANRMEEFEEILKLATSDEASSFFADDAEGRIKMLNAYAAYKITLARKFHRSRKRRKQQKQQVVFCQTIKNTRFSLHTKKENEKNVN